MTLNTHELFRRRFLPFDDKVKKTKAVGGRSDITFVEWAQYIIRGWQSDFPLGFSTEIRSITEVGGVQDLLAGKKGAKTLTLVDDRQVVLVIRVTDMSDGSYQEGTGTAPVAKDKTNYGGALAEAESQGLRRAFAKFGVGLEMYLDDDEFEAVNASFQDDHETVPAGEDPGSALPSAPEPEEWKDPLGITADQQATLVQLGKDLREWAEEEKVGGDHGDAEMLIEEMLGKARAKVAGAKDAQKAAGIVIRKLREWAVEYEVALADASEGGEDPQ